MASHARSYGGSNDWDSMKEDYENSTYDAQYPDDDANINGGVQLDHCRLYIPNIPKGLNVQGLRSAFGKFGTLTEVHISNDPQKKYGLVSFETPGEAKLAMMKLNKAEPLKLTMYIAHKKKPKVSRDNRNDAGPSAERSTYRDGYNVNDNRGLYKRRQEDIPNGETNMNDLPADEDSMNINDPLDPDLSLELEQLKLEHLKLQEAQIKCRHRMLLLKQAEKRTSLQSTTTDRCILPDGKIVVRNVDRAADISRDADVSGAGAGDSLKIPGLQRVGSRACVVCGSQADSFCARCGVTPYCSPKCQRRDWMDRHKAVCHNLAHLSTEETDPKPPVDVEFATPAAPLRRPRSPDKQNVRRPQQRADDCHSTGSDKSTKIPQRNPNSQHNNNSSKPYRNNTRGGFKNRSNDRNQHHARRQPLHRETKNQLPNGDEEWLVTNLTKLEQFKPTQPRPMDQEISKNQPKPMDHEINKDKSKPVLPAEKSLQSVKSALKVTKPPTNEPQVAKTEIATETLKLVPEHSVIDLMDIGDTCFLSVDNKASECRVSRDGFVCVAINAQLQADYELLCGEEYVSQCEASNEEYTPSIGESFSYYCPHDEGWYRCRLLTSSSGALIDTGRLVTIDASSNCRPLSGTFAKIPEFCCLLEAENIKLGDDPLCCIKEKTSEHLIVTLEMKGQIIGNGKLSRWLPEIEYPKMLPSPSVEPGLINSQILHAEVPRPYLLNGSKVILVYAIDAQKASVRPADLVAQRRYDAVLQDVLQYAIDAVPLSEPPNKGQIVVAKYTDGLHYRAVCKRTNVKMNKYMMEYIEFGNVEICKLEDLYPCPPKLDLTSRPTETSMIVFEHVGPEPFNEHAVRYVDELKDDALELTLMLPNGGKSAPSGSNVILTVVKNNENVNKKLKELCTPEWKKIEEKGGDVIETEVMMFKDLEYIKFPSGACELVIVDVSMLNGGTISAYVKGMNHVDKIQTELASRMVEYCNSEIGREPYLPSSEELCIAQSPSDGLWYRAVMCAQPEGAGGATAKVCYVDYGNVEIVPVTSLRKILAEFVTGLPALSASVEIRDFPKGHPPPMDMISRAVEYMKIDEQGCGVLHVQNCEFIENGFYVVDAPELLAFIGVK